jgi:uncharacterized protein YuzE
VIKPQSVRIDFEVNAAYVSYADGEVAGTRDVWKDGWVAADTSADGSVLGIEVLGLDRDTLAQARRFAEANGLAFPAHLEDVTIFA